MTVFLPIRPTSLREQVVEQVRTAIIEGRLKPNDHIIEKDLTEQLGVSRTPVREALILLEREGLIVSIPHRGSFVRVFNEKDVDHIFSMRTMLENFAGELTIHHLTDEDHAHLEFTISLQQKKIEQGDLKSVRSLDMQFHQFLVRSSQHPLLIRNWQEIVAQIAGLLYIRKEAVPDYDEYLAIVDHQKILAAYKNRDIDALRMINQSVNERVANECRLAVQKLK